MSLAHPLSDTPERGTGAPSPIEIKAFAATIDGVVLTPEDQDFDEARLVRSTLTDGFRPALIVRAAGPADVARTIVLAAETGLRLAVRSGGHSLAGHSTIEGGIVLDLSRMNGVEIDPERRVAVVGPGATSGDVSNAAQVHGLAVPFGDTKTVGVGGITTGGGIGYLVRRHGLTIDHLLEAEVVTADGQIMTVDDGQHSDLFWAIRGGGGNFGVVTRLVFSLVPVGETVIGGGLFLPASAEVIAGVSAAAASAPEDLTTITFVMPAPPAPFIPEARVGELVVVVVAVWLGDPAETDAVFAPFRALAEPVVDLIGPIPYPAIYEYTVEAEARQAESLRSFMTDEIDLPFARTIMEFMERATSTLPMVQIRVLGGALARVPADATAFAHRAAPVMFTLMNAIEDDDPERHIAWTRDFYAALAHRRDGVYVNFLEDEGEARIREAYPAATYERLVAIKRRYDPDNLFRLNQNIAPD